MDVRGDAVARNTLRLRNGAGDVSDRTCVASAIWGHEAMRWKLGIAQDREGDSDG